MTKLNALEEKRIKEILNLKSSNIHELLSKSYSMIKDNREYTKDVQSSLNQMAIDQKTIEEFCNNNGDNITDNNLIYRYETNQDNFNTILVNYMQQDIKINQKKNKLIEDILFSKSSKYSLLDKQLNKAYLRLEELSKYLFVLIETKNLEQIELLRISIKI